MVLIAWKTTLQNHGPRLDFNCGKTLFDHCKVRFASYEAEVLTPPTPSVNTPFGRVYVSV